MTVTSRQVSELSTQLRGVTYSKEDAVDTAQPGYLPVLRAGNIEEHGLTFDDLVYVPASKVSDKQRLRKHDVLIAASSGSIDVVGKAARALKDFDGGFGAFCKVLRPNGQVDPGYFAHYFKTPEYRRKVSSLAAGANINNLRNEDLDNLEIPFLSLAEQKRIAGILDAADALRAKRREAIAQLDILPQATFLHLFGDLQTNPKGWPSKSLGELINFVGGSQPPKETFTYVPSDDTVRLIQIRDFKSDRFMTFIPKRLAKRPCKEDDVMIARYGPPVFQILKGLKGSYNVALMKAEPIGHVDKSFLFYLLSDPILNAAVVAQSDRTAGQSGVNLKFLDSYQAFLPPFELQKRFAAIVESMERQKASHRAHLAELDTLFASLQSRAFRGEL